MHAARHLAAVLSRVSAARWEAAQGLPCRAGGSGEAGVLHVSASLLLGFYHKPVQLLRQSQPLVGRLSC